MTDACVRCGTHEGDLAPGESLRALSRFERDHSDLETETVCGHCCTQTERVVADRFSSDPMAVAYMLSLSDAINRIAMNRGFVVAPTTVPEHLTLDA